MTIGMLIVMIGLLVAAISDTSEANHRHEEFDFIVIGAGTTGGALLEILSRESYGFSVLGLERGPDDVKRKPSDFTGMRTQDDYNYVSPHDPVFISTSQEAANEKQIYIPRFRGVGGTSKIYGMIARKPSSSVLEKWPNGWQYVDMKKYYKRVESHYCYYLDDSGIPEGECHHYHGKNGPMAINTLNEAEFKPFSSAFTSVCSDEGAIWGGRTNDYNGKNHNGCGLFQQYKFLDEDGKWARGGSHTGYLTEKVLARDNLEIRTGSPVTRIAFDSNGRAVGVYYLASPDSIRYVAARKEIILSAGSFDTPILLQVSGVGPKDILKKIKVPRVVAFNEQVGKNLWDHVSVPYVLKKVEHHDHSDKWSYQNGPFSWMIHANLEKGHDRSKISSVQVYFMDNSSMFTKADQLCKGHIDTKNEATLRIIDQFPDYRGSISAQTTSIFDRPYVDMGWDDSNGNATIQKFETMVKEFHKYWQDDSTDWSKEVVGELYMDDGIEKWAHRYMESALHPACTCAMGKCADKHLHVKGVQGLRVCDASAFATQVDGNPVATLFAMAEKLGEELLNEYSHNERDEL